MDIREIIETVESARRNIRKELSRIDHALSHLNQLESEIHSEKDMTFKGKVIHLEGFGFEVDSGTAYLSEYLHEFEGEDVVVNVISV